MRPGRGRTSLPSHVPTRMSVFDSRCLRILSSEACRTTHGGGGSDRRPGRPPGAPPRPTGDNGRSVTYQPNLLPFVNAFGHPLGHPLVAILIGPHRGGGGGGGKRGESSARQRRERAACAAPPPPPAAPA